MTVSEVQAFFTQTLRDGRARANQRKVVEGLISARKQELDRALMNLQMKRVRVTDQRMWVLPTGNPNELTKRQMSAMSETAGAVGHSSPRTSVSECIVARAGIADAALSGEVTHLHCKDQFSARLAAVRG